MDLQTPYGGRNRMKFTRHEYFGGILGTIVLILLVVGYAFELKYFSNTFNASSMVFRALGVGFVIGLLSGFYFSKNIKEPLEKFQIIVALMFAGLIVTPLLASWINRGFSSNIQYEPVELQEQQAFSQSRFGQLEGKMTVDGYYLFFIKNRKLERVKAKTLLFPKDTPKGTRVEIPIKKGGLGFEYFVEDK